MLHQSFQGVDMFMTLNMNAWSTSLRDIAWLLGNDRAEARWHRVRAALEAPSLI